MLLCILPASLKTSRHISVPKKDTDRLIKLLLMFFPLLFLKRRRLKSLALLFQGKILFPVLNILAALFQTFSTLFNSFLKCYPQTGIQTQLHNSKTTSLISLDIVLLMFTIHRALLTQWCRNKAPIQLTVHRVTDL